MYKAGMELKNKLFEYTYVKKSIGKNLIKELQHWAILVCNRTLFRYEQSSFQKNLGLCIPKMW